MSEWISVEDRLPPYDIEVLVYQPNWKGQLVTAAIFLAHRLAWMYMYGNFPPDEIDHINGVRDDNRIINLRAVSHAENAKNQRINSTNTSGVTGVSWNKAAQKWKAQVRQDNKTLYFGIYSNFLDAICARKSAEHILGFHPNHGK